jgi:hypothetical protein
MKFFLVLSIFSSFLVVFAIEPVVIVHGGAGSVAAHRVSTQSMEWFRHTVIQSN